MAVRIASPLLGDNSPLNQCLRPVSDAVLSKPRIFRSAFTKKRKSRFIVK
jgi:hypothetical protein